MRRTQPATEPDGPAEICAALRAVLDRGDKTALAAALDKFDALEATLDRLLAEHSGMAEELLRVYEQLGIVFEVARKLPTVRDEAEVVRLFVENLRPTYPTARVEAVELNSDHEPVLGGQGIELAPWTREALAQCRDERRVVVVDCPDCRQVSETPPQPPEPDPQQPAPARGTGLPSRGTGFQPFVQVMCGPIFAGDTFICALLLGQQPASGSEPDIRSFDVSDMLLLDSLNMFCGDMIRSFHLLSEVRQLSVDMVRVLVNAIEQKDEYTSGHTTRVGHFAKLLGRELGLDHARLQVLEWSALLHDIGKIGIRDEVLKKPGRLTDEEFQHIKEHPVRSFRVVSEVPQLADALDGVMHHHEHWDGSGYPDGLVGEKIPLLARIIQVADIFDALTSTRSYRKAFDWAKALDILDAEAGETVDPELCAVFSGLIRRMAGEQSGLLEQILSIRRGWHTTDLADGMSPRALSRAGTTTR